MLILTYNPFKGKAYRDADCDAAVADMIARVNAGKTVRRAYASENLLYALRCAVYRREIPPVSVRLLFAHPDGVTLEMRMDRDAGLDRWPRGFCDYNDNWLRELIQWKKPEE